jgi:hypothetical protein
MKKVVLAIPFAVAFATIAFADSRPVRPAPVPDMQKIPPPVDRGRTGFVVLRQDLFDRNSQNNLRSDYPAVHRPNLAPTDSYAVIAFVHFQERGAREPLAPRR